MSSNIPVESVELIRRANDCLVDPKRFRAPEPLFDEFWREGELALMFGPPSSGKSLFAVQLGDALARGGGLPGFRLPRGRRRVLYADLRHTDEQFQMRCMGMGVGHKFPLNLFRDRPAAGTDLCEWLRKCVTANKIQVVIIDDLSAFKNTHDGTRETLKLMRRLRGLRDELGISILVLTDSAQPKGGVAVSEADLGRSRILCTVADSVFAIGRSLKRVGDHYFVQTRLRNAPVFWTVQNAPVAQIDSTKRGLLAFRFDDRFNEHLDPERRRRICEISRLAEVEGKSFREIAAQLGISKSWACELYKKWTPAMEESKDFARERLGIPADGRSGDLDLDDDLDDDWNEDAEYSYDDEEDDEVDEDEFRVEEDDAEPEFSGPADDPGPTATDDTASPTTEPEPPTHRRIRDLERDFDGYGREIFVEKRQENDRKPAIWYSINHRTGHHTRHERHLYGINLKNIGLSGMILRE